MPHYLNWDETESVVKHTVRYRLMISRYRMILVYSDFIQWGFIWVLWI